MRSPVRIVLIIVASFIALTAVAAGVFLATFDPNQLKPRIQDAVQRATGRALAMNGAIVIKPSLWPTIEVRDVAFANPPGFSRPQMAKLQAMDLQLGLLPLLSGQVEIDRLVLIHPDILLEQTTGGADNWTLTPQPDTHPAAQNAPSGTTHRTAVSVRSIRLSDGTLAYRSDRTGVTQTLAVATLVANAAAPNAPLHLDMQATYDGTRFTLIGDTGGLTRLQDPAATTPWPVDLQMKAAGASLSAKGSLTHPLQGKGYDLLLNASVPDLSALAPLLSAPAPQAAPAAPLAPSPAPVLPALRDVTLAAKVADQGGEIPAVSAFTLHIGTSDLSDRVPGLTLDRLNVSAASMAQGFKADGAGKLGDMPLSINVTVGPADLLAANALPPVPVEMMLQAGGATTTAKATLVAAAGGFVNGAALNGLTLSGRDADLAGTASWSMQPRPSLIARLTSDHIDLDALHTALDRAREQAASRAGPQQGDAQPPARAAGAAATKPRGGRLFADQPIPFELLREADADLTLGIGTLRSGGVDYKAIQTHAVLAAGKLTVDPMSADLQQSHMQATLAVDANPPAPPVHLTLNAPGLALKSLLAAFNQPPLATGNMQVLADLNGTGATPHAIAASLGGNLSLAISGGTIDNRLVGSLLGSAVPAINALNLVGRGGTSDLRCFAARLEASHGIATIRSLLLSSSLVTIGATGSLNLGQETLDVTLLPQMRIGGAGVVVPIALRGPFDRPETSVSKTAAASDAGAVAGAVIGNATPLGIIGGVLGADKLSSNSESCPTALAAARGQKAPPVASSNGSKPSSPGANPADTLRKLFR